MSYYINKCVAQNISSFSPYYDNVKQLAPLAWDQLQTLAFIKNHNKLTIQINETTSKTDRTLFFINGNFNYSFNIQNDLENLKEKMNRQSRVAIVLYSSYMAWIYKIATILKIRSGELPTTFITEIDFENIVKLSGFEQVSKSDMIYFPFSLFGLGTLINKIIKLIPIFNKFALVSLRVLRPKISTLNPSLTILIPARNEKGNIESALKRIPQFPGELEVIFIEGNSSDNTWEEIATQIEKYENSRNWILKRFKQTGKGKFDAVKKGIEHATKDIITILDADLTMPPELLPQFYNAYASGVANFINGSRLVYSMENEAMRFLNLIANISFSKILSSILEVKLGDSLCGTKMFSRLDYQAMERWNKDFGEFDPFGDFELIFSAAQLQFGIVDIPVRYQARTYGETQIRRFRDGFLLLKMTIRGFLSIKLKKL